MDRGQKLKNLREHLPKRFSYKAVTDEMARIAGYGSRASLLKAFRTEALCHDGCVLRMPGRVYAWNEPDAGLSSLTVMNGTSCAGEGPTDNELLWAFLQERSADELKALRALTNAGMEVEGQLRHRIGGKNHLCLDRQGLRDFVRVSASIGLLFDVGSSEHGINGHIWEVETNLHRRLLDLLDAKGRMKSFPRTMVLHQNRQVVYVLCLDAETVKKLCRIRRFSADRGGVNRELNEPHAMRIALAMNDPEVLWPEAIVATPRGLWGYEEGRFRYVPGEFCFVADDGQHRTVALQSGKVEPERMKLLQFTVICPPDLKFQDRLRLTLNQGKRKRPNPNEELAWMYETGQWPNDAWKEAYGLVLELNAQPTSPLYERIGIVKKAGLQDDGTEEGSLRRLKAKTIHTALRKIVGSARSPVVSFPEAERRRIIFDTFQMASETWTESWGQPGSALASDQKSLAAILTVLADGTHFARIVGHTFTPRAIREALGYASRFDWSTDAINRHGLAKVIAERLDDAIGRGYNTATRRKSRRSSK